MRDGFAIAGLCLLAAGTWWLSPPWALVVVGGLLLVAGVLGTIFGRRKRE